ncbi:Uma2 family endonuclease [Longimicrobium terrae]|uniref:Uma2 family endonuclease n=1 Tax=Longimicrobium terrae TaxID=1639882 RepID=A0A841GWC7_9BACT|nr:Uma2 family endonuclease [Longimicrobium terrae]MBB4634594.1 Uma2 family endonuclease [Longimicrobium terrae]MBB6068516.1 Uma2 family endonuclease [Longimicrobium terrae]NNC27706.1 Uma2 family endonuclease [Longimicrobium terrae]
MATHPARRGWSYAEFRRLPDDGNRYEVIDGELFVTPSPLTIHQKIVGRIFAAIEAFCEEHGAGTVLFAPCDVIFGEGDYLEPDLVFVRRDREEIIGERGIEGPPDLVVEVLSESTAMRDRGIKRDRYAGYGVPEYWIVDSDAKAIEVYRLIQNDLRRTQIARDVLSWSPGVDGPELLLDVPHLLRPLKDHSRSSR